jgi:hypothetical protein
LLERPSTINGSVEQRRSKAEKLAKLIDAKPEADVDRLVEAARLALHAGVVCCSWDKDLPGQSTRDAADKLRQALEPFNHKTENKDQTLS